jgi:hypothetical protein
VALTFPRRALGVSVLTAGLALAFVPAAQAAEPDTIINSGPENGAVVLPGPVQFAFSSDVGPNVTFQCKVDNGVFAACTSPATYDLAPGGHIFTVRALDAVLTPDSSPASRIWTVRNVPCEQAGAAYKAAQSKFFVQQQKLVKARKQLHRAHAHGTAAQFQHAKNKVRHIKAKIFKLRQAMNEALAQEAAVC